MRRILPLLFGLLRAFIAPRRAAIISEWRASQLLASQGDAAYWKRQDDGHIKDLEAERAAHSYSKVELGAARVQIDCDAKIIHALNEQRMADARIAATRAQGPPSNADILGRVTE